MSRPAERFDSFVTKTKVGRGYLQMWEILGQNNGDNEICNLLKLDIIISLDIFFIFIFKLWKGAYVVSICLFENVLPELNVHLCSFLFFIKGI